MIDVPFITVEGPIGVGKTSLAKAIADHFNLHLLKEIVNENPFLDKFYTNIEEWSFQTEMFFLCNRYKQLEDIEQQYLHNNLPVVADYHILKNLIFADRTLKSTQLRKYHQIYDILTSDMRTPNVVVYLTASLETLQKRIEMRGREFEKNIEPSYLQQLIEDYESTIATFERTYPHIPVLRFNGDMLDFVHKKADLHYILSAVNETLEKETSKS
jgi:deoxyguanosine kinase